MGILDEILELHWQKIKRRKGESERGVLEDRQEDDWIWVDHTFMLEIGLGLQQFD